VPKQTTTGIAKKQFSNPSRAPGMYGLANAMMITNPIGPSKAPRHPPASPTGITNRFATCGHSAIV